MSLCEEDYVIFWDLDVWYICGLFLGAFAKLQNAITSFVMFVRQSVYPTVCLHGTTRAPLNEFS
jgi:hypothetical protein